ncbi:MAG: DUF58 domain-containing protein [Myxococcales bacterium]|nr:DUF58 domain-containing protein [Myxococcales bacterium]MCB9519997.1 DUF58 domain-containing protein [Myxococcales bacterium]MCB9534356.1 DUF58 domain-containing protein [Myxococcales bacterium]
MIPHLTASGARLLLAGCAILAIGVWARSVPVIIVAQLLLGALGVAYVATLPLVWAVERRQLRLVARAIPGGGDSSTRELRWGLQLENASGAAIGRAELSFAASPGLTPGPTVNVTGLRSGESAPVDAAVDVAVAGRVALFGARARLFVGPRWVVVAAYLPTYSALKLAPGWRRARGRLPPARRRDPRLPGGAVPVPIAGHGYELHELRDFVPSDSVRRVDWKASARRNRLTVRELADEVVVTTSVVLDVSSTMRSAGGDKLRFAQGIVAAAAADVGTSGDRLGVILADDSILAHLRPGAGGRHRARAVDAALAADAIVESGRTDASDSELTALVVDHILLHDGFDFRRPGQVAEYAPDAERFDLASLEAYLAAREVADCAPVEAELRAAGLPAGHESLVRRFARARCLRPAYREESRLPRKAEGMAVALDAAVGDVRGQGAVVFVTDGAGLDSLDPVTAALARALHGRTPVVVILLETATFLAAAPDDRTAARAWELFVDADRERTSELAAALQVSGASVVRVGASDPPERALALALAAARAPRRSSRLR